MKFSIILAALLVGLAQATIPHYYPTPDSEEGIALTEEAALLPPSPLDAGYTVPTVPDDTPENSVPTARWSGPAKRTKITLQERSSLTSNDWTTVTIILTEAPTGFYRVLIEKAD